MSDAFDLDAQVNTPKAGETEVGPLSISSIATRTVCTRVACKVTSTCACTSLCTALCRPEQ
ncbi:FDLD family class I lanthipeptide [Streptomyces sp. 549]|uniref:FDLD family class I lanthipeptide n=1 Tax=Streptomyces sp. 549 TaxID=3049076 RepID=UPI0024C255AB|nr:FDLD family class I lanthipeptide [Streptomyces sp. 549]MDK1473101.1 FDLD family class I lanthipeptide [Streptomyces sp. 549]